MEYVSGRSLDLVLRRAAQVHLRLNEHAMLLLGVQVCDALAYAHGAAKPMVHRDICPSNLLVSFAGQVKLTNFGVAQAASVAARARAVFYRDHFAYLAPEQLRGAALDGRADLFSLGAVLYEVLTGARLLGGRTDDTVIARLRAGEVPSARTLVPELSVDVEAMLQRALSPSPAGRYASATAMGVALRDILTRRYGGGDPHLLAQVMGELFPQTVQREAVLWKRLVRAGWVPPQATAVVRWLGSGLPDLGTPMLAIPRARQRPPPAMGGDGIILFLASGFGGHGRPVFRFDTITGRNRPPPLCSGGANRPIAAVPCPGRRWGVGSQKNARQGQEQGAPRQACAYHSDWTGGGAWAFVPRPG